MKLPLAVYTANHGLEWRFPQAEISLSELERVRRSLGKLPDFDAGDSGFVGIHVEPTRIFVEKVQSVRAWDFRRRDATYLTMTWFDRDVLSKDLITSILMTDEFVTPSRTAQEYFNVRIVESDSHPQTTALNWMDESFELISTAGDKNLRINDVGEVVTFKNQSEDFCSKRSNGAREEKRINENAPNLTSCSKGYDLRNIVLMAAALVALLVATNLFICVMDCGEEYDSAGSMQDEKMAIVQSLGTNDVTDIIVGDSICCVSDSPIKNDLQPCIDGDRVHGTNVTNAMDATFALSSEIEPAKHLGDEDDEESIKIKRDLIIDQKDLGNVKGLGLTDMLMKGER